MPSHAVHALVARGIDWVAANNADSFQAFADNSDDAPNFAFKVSPWASALLALTIIAFIVVSISIRYTLWGPVFTLACVEQEPDSFEAAPFQVNPDGSVAVDPEANAANKSYITSSIRRTIRHLQTKAGWTARWRGLWLFVFCIVVQSIIQSAVDSVLQAIPLSFLAILSPFLVPLLSTFVLARLWTTYTHIVISEPSPKRWWSRLAPTWTFRNVWQPTLIAQFTSYFSLWLPTRVASRLRLTDGDRVSGMTPGGISWRVLVCGLIFLVCYVSLALPASVALTRVQASMLPEEDESIVSFDRSFGGRVEPRIVGGSGAVSFIGAWRSFDKSARVRILKLCGKILAIDIALNVFFIVLLAVEIYGLAHWGIQPA